MKITKVTKLTEKYNQYDLTTTTKNFYVNVGGKDLLVHNSPSVVFGHHPENGKFFVGTKAALSKNPTLNYTHEDIEKNHGHTPGLVPKLKSALDHLSKVTPKTGIYQGDYMYDDDSVHRSDKEHSFTPNTLQYTAPADSEEGKKIAKAKLGMAIHTKYHGRSLDNMVAGFDPDLHKFKKHSDVHIIPHEISGDILHSATNQQKFEHHIKAAESAKNSAPEEALKDVAPHTQNIQKYINKTVRNAEKPSISGYRTHLMDTTKKEMESLKTAKGRDNKHKDLMNKLHHVENHQKSFDALFKIHHHLQQAKNALIDTLDQHSPYEHSINGKETKGEGYVTVHKGHPIKLVNRAEFSAANFNAHK